MLATEKRKKGNCNSSYEVITKENPLGFFFIQLFIPVYDASKDLEWSIDWPLQLHTGLKSLIATAESIVIKKTKN